MPAPIDDLGPGQVGRFSKWIKEWAEDPFVPEKGLLTILGIVGITILFGFVVGSVNTHFNPGAENPQTVADRIANQQKTEVIEKVKAAAKSFSSTPRTNVAALEYTYKALSNELNASADVGATAEVAKFRQAIAKSDTLYSRLSEIDSLDANTKPFEIPEKPVYEEPKYEGAYYLSGYYRGIFVEGGIVLRVAARHHGAFGGLEIVRDEQYVVVENGKEPMVVSQTGYVENTGRTGKLNIGRDGRDAEVVRLVDIETFRDDQKAHRDRIAEAKADFKEALKNYNDAIKQRKETESQAIQLRYERAKARKDLLARKPEVLSAAAVAVESALSEPSGSR